MRTIETTRFAMSTASAGNTQDVTISGFGTPKAVIFMWTSAVADDTLTDDAAFGIGYVDGTRNIVRYMLDQDGRSTMTTERINDNTAAIAVRISGSIVARFSFNSWVTDGIRLDIDTATATAYLVTAVFLGEGVSDVYAGSFNIASTSGADIAVTDPGFEPDVVMLSHTALNGNVTGSFDVHFSLGLAVNDGLDTQRWLAFYSQSAVSTTNVASGIFTSESAGRIATTLTYDVLLKDFDYQGFTITPVGSALASHDVAYLAFKFGPGVPELSLFDMEWPLTGNYSETFNFRPDFGFNFALVDPPTRDTVYTNRNPSICAAVFDADTIYSLSCFSADNIGTSVTGSLVDDRLKYVAAISFAAASSYQFTDTGWNFTMSQNKFALGFSLAVKFPIPQGAVFQGNTIVAADPQTFDESPVLGSPADVSYLWTADPDSLIGNLFLSGGVGGGHAINLLEEGEFSFNGNNFTEQWLDGTSPDGNGTPEAALFNGVGQVILNIVDGDVPTFLDKQSPGTTLNQNVSVTITNLQPLTEVRVYLAEDFNSPIDTNQLAGVEDTGSPTEFTFSAAAGTVVDIVIHNVDYLLPPNNRIRNFTVPTSTTSFPVSQILDRNRI